MHNIAMRNKASKRRIAIEIMEGVIPVLHCFNIMIVVTAEETRLQQQMERLDGSQYANLRRSTLELITIVYSS
jgi:hypothetical protein